MGTTASASMDDIRATLSAGRSALLWRKLIADTETPISAALKLMQAERGDFLLESVEGGAVRGRYSLLGLDPDLVFRAEGDNADDPGFAQRVYLADRRGMQPLHDHDVQFTPVPIDLGHVEQCRASEIAA